MATNEDSRAKESIKDQPATTELENKTDELKLEDSEQIVGGAAPPSGGGPLQTH